MKPLRSVWMVSLWFPPPMEGGSLVYTFNLCANLPAAELHVLTTRASGAGELDSQLPFTTYRSLITGLNAGKFRRVAVAASWLLYSARAIFRKPSVMVAADTTAASQVCLVLAYIFGVPYVVLIYAEELTKLANCRSRRWNRRLDRWLKIRSLKGAAGFVSVSDFALEQLHRFGVRAKRATKIIPMVTPPAKVTATEVRDARSKWQILGSDRVVLSVGRLVERKGHDQLLAAWPAVRAAYPDAKLLIVGRGEREEFLRKLAADSDLNESVVFAGFVPDAELPRYYEMCEMLVMPHRTLVNGDTEGCPTVFLEANAYGKPVVGGDAGGVRDAIVHGVTGLIVDGNDTGAIAGAVCDLLGDPALARRLGENGQRRVLEELSPGQGGARLLEFLQCVVDDTVSSS